MTSFINFVLDFLHEKTNFNIYAMVILDSIEIPVLLCFARHKHNADTGFENFNLIFFYYILPKCRLIIVAFLIVCVGFTVVSICLFIVIYLFLFSNRKKNSPILLMHSWQIIILWVFNLLDFFVQENDYIYEGNN